MDEDSILRKELFDWFVSQIPTQVECHSVKPSDFATFVALPSFNEKVSQSQEPPRESKKLALVLDLDLTLVHALQLHAFADPFDPALLGTVRFGSDSDNPQIFCLWLDDQPYVIKLRPGVRKFLRELAPFYELNIFTKATRPYLNFLLATLDPDKSIFSTSISRDDAPELDIDTKVMSLVSNRPLTELVVFDDRATVWRECHENVIRAEPYVFLEKKMGSLAAAVNNSTGFCQDPDRQLDAICDVLKSIYVEFSRLPAEKADVRNVIKLVRSRTLAGCRIMFSGVPRDEIAEYAANIVSLGGEVSTDEDDLPTELEVEPNISHLIVVGGGKHNTKKVHEARKFNGKVNVLHGSWLVHAANTWTKPDEVNFDLSLFPYDGEGKTAYEIDPWEYSSKK